MLLFVCAVGLLSLAGFAFPASPLALPAALAGLSSLVIALG
jgi:hypothetical protein